MSLEGQTTKLTPVQAEAKLSPTGRLPPPWQPGCIRSKVLARSFPSGGQAWLPPSEKARERNAPEQLQEALAGLGPSAGETPAWPPLTSPSLRVASPASL